MTVSYSSEVFTSCQGRAPASVFLKLLLRWRGSIYKLVWHDLLIYVLLYYLLSCTYRFALDDESERQVFPRCFELLFFM